MSRLCHLWLLVSSIALFASACAPSGAPTASPTSLALAGHPNLSVSTPRDGELFAAGSTVSIQSAASDSRGIVRIELWVDGVLYRMDVTKESEGLPSVSVTQTWPAADLGNHVLLLKAFNRDGIASEPRTINISVVPQSAIATPTPPADRTAIPTQAPTAVPPTAAATTVAGCDPDAVFVSDVTVPDGTVFKPGDAISKVWRLRNSGSCAWTAGSQLAFVDGAQMGAVPAPVAAVAPAATVDVSLAMVAPRPSGTYTGRWRLRSADGKFFGQSVSIVIRVVDPSPPTPAPTTTPAAITADFSVNRNTIPYGDCATLKWDVENATAVRLRIGDGNAAGVVGHDTRQVCPTDSTDYTLQAFPSTGEALEKMLTIDVSPPTKAASAVVPVGSAVDLDLGIKDPTVTANSEFQWDAAHNLQPKNGAMFVRAGTRSFTDVQKDECLNNTGYSAASLGGGQVGAGSVLCFKTNAGHSGKLWIKSSDGDLEFRWVTW